MCVGVGVGVVGGRASSFTRFNWADPYQSTCSRHSAAGEIPAIINNLKLKLLHLLCTFLDLFLFNAFEG